MTRRALRLAAVLVWVFAMDAAPSNAEPVIAKGTSGAIELEHGGAKRLYRVHVPKSYDAAKPMPLVMMLHGAGGNAVGSLKRYGWAKKADDETFLAVFPEATTRDPSKPYSFQANPRIWADGSGRSFADRRGVDDVGYIRAIVDDAAARWSIDPKRVYVTGFSNGASMTWRLGVEMADRLAAIAPMLGHLWMNENAKPAGGRAVPAIFMMGLVDPLNPAEGGDVNLPWGIDRNKPPMARTVERYRQIIGAPSTPETLIDRDGVKAVRYEGTGGVEFVYYTIDDLGHTWPGAAEVLPESMVGRQTNKLNATDVIWEFFEKHSR